MNSMNLTLHEISRNVKSYVTLIWVMNLENPVRRSKDAESWSLGKLSNVVAIEVSINADKCKPRNEIIYTQVTVSLYKKRPFARSFARCLL